MYLAKVYRVGLSVHANVCIKRWDELLGSHVIELIGANKFLTRRAAHMWIFDTIAQDLQSKGKMEIENG